MKRMLVIVLVWSCGAHAMGDMLKAAQKTTNALLQETPDNVQITATVKFHEEKRTKSVFGGENTEILDRSYSETVYLEKSVLGWKQKENTTNESTSKRYQVALLLQCSMSSRAVGVQCIVKRLTNSGSTESLSQIASQQCTIPSDKIGAGYHRREDVKITDDPQTPNLEITIRSN